MPPVAGAGSGALPSSVKLAVVVANDLAIVQLYPVGTEI